MATVIDFNWRLDDPSLWALSTMTKICRAQRQMAVASQFLKLGRTNHALVLPYCATGAIHFCQRA